MLDEGKSVAPVARDLDLTEAALRTWVTRARGNRSRGRTGLTTAEREELALLRKENRQLRREREILKNAVAFFCERASDTFTLIHVGVRMPVDARTRRLPLDVTRRANVRVGSKL